MAARKFGQHVNPPHTHTQTHCKRKAKTSIFNVIYNQVYDSVSIEIPFLQYNSRGD